jgi:hypothetical protein
VPIGAAGTAGTSGKLLGAGAVVVLGTIAAGAVGRLAISMGAVAGLAT